VTPWRKAVWFPTGGSAFAGSGGRLSVSEQLPDPDFVTITGLRRELQAAGLIEESTQRHLAIACTSTWVRGKA
jgi:hypothetical protein